jgi:hypothetical protein
MQQSELRALYVQFLDQNTQTFAGRHFEIAYHALAAAMHCAEGLRDRALLAEVQRLAEEQRHWIDSHAPEHRLSSRNAMTRGNDSIFASAARQAHVMLLGLEVDHQAEEVRRLNDLGNPS